MIIRIHKDSNFTVMSNYHLKDNNLSWKAKGLLSYLLTLPDDWKLYLKELETHASDKRGSTESGVKELLEAGYILRTERREKGQFAGHDYDIYEQPPMQENRSGLTVAEKPKSENQQLLNTNNNQILNKLNTESRGKRQPRFKPPSETEVGQYIKDLEAKGKSVNFSPGTFIDYYQSKGWMIGKNKMKDWKAAVRTWIRKDTEQRAPDVHEMTAEEYCKSQGLDL